MDFRSSKHAITLQYRLSIEKIVANHGWESETFSKKSKAPFSEMLAKEIIESGKGPLSKSPEAMTLQNEMGFSYWMLLGELIFAYVVARLDIGYSMSLVSRYAEYPTKVHYTGLKSVKRYLRERKNCPIIYWRKEPFMELAKGTFAPYKIQDKVVYPFPDDLYIVTTDIDASQATDIETRRSTGGHIIMIFGAAILWASKLQSTMATSSTEAEFMQVVTLCKGVKWVRNIMNELKCTQSGPSHINENNMASIMMVNQNCPTTRTRHIDIQWFAIQQWKEMGDIVLQ